MKIYPAWVYHKDHGSRIVQTVEAEAALGPGWVDSPAKVNDTPEVTPEQTPEVKPEVIEHKRPGRPKAKK